MIKTQGNNDGNSFLVALGSMAGRPNAWRRKQPHSTHNRHLSRIVPMQELNSSRSLPPFHAKQMHSRIKGIAPIASSVTKHNRKYAKFPERYVLRGREFGI